MSLIYFPQMALGVPIYNPTFSIPSENVGGGNVSAGWDESSDWDVESALWGDGPTPGHTRAQRYRLNSISTLVGYSTSAPLPPGYMTGTSTTKTSLWLYCRATYTGTITPPNYAKISVYANCYNSADSLLGAHLIYQRDLASEGKLDDWTGVIAAADFTADSGTNHLRLKIRIDRDIAVGNNVTLDLAFIGWGVWDDSAGSYTWARKMSHPSFSTPVDETRLQDPNRMGWRRAVDWDRYVDPYRTSISLSMIDDTLKQKLLYARSMNRGRRWGPVSTSLTGGIWPLLFFSGNPSCLAMGAYDFEGGWGLRTGGSWQPADPYWSGTINLIERVWE